MGEEVETTEKLVAELAILVTMEIVLLRQEIVVRR
jgi:hypothetical protein